MLLLNPVSGAQTCARYAFAPNFYHYCGPDRNEELREYLCEGETERPLLDNLAQFETLYPYLQAIAEANGIQDPFAPKVVEAYWIGNELLEKVSAQETFAALTEKQQLARRLPKRELAWLLPKIDLKAKLHHSFHVFNVFTRTGHHTVSHTVDSMDKCIIGWGKVIRKETDGLLVSSQQLQYRDGTLEFVKKNRKIVPSVEAVAQPVTEGDWISFHWNILCDTITVQQVKQLKKYTEHHLALANTTL